MSRIRFSLSSLLIVALLVCTQSTAQFYSPIGAALVGYLLLYGISAMAIVLAIVAQWRNNAQLLQLANQLGGWFVVAALAALCAGLFG